MRHLLRTCLYASTILAGTAAAVPALAQEGDIVVTARRTEERLQDVPISITVLNQQQLQNRNIVSASELATFTPSLTTNTRFGTESSSFAIRGFTQEGVTSPSVAVYFADVVAPRANGGTTGGNGAGVGSFFDLQNVQVLKGPQGTLFGRNTTGGAVLLVPQKPTGRLEGYVEGSVGNYDMRRAQAVVNVPFGDSFRVRLGVDRQTRDGYLHNVSGIGPADFNDVDYVAARLSMVADLTPNLENYTIITYAHSDTNGSFPKLYYAGASPARQAQLARTSGDFWDVASGNPDARQQNWQWQIINTTTWKASDTITLKNIASYAEFMQDQTGNIFGEDGAPVTGNPPSYTFFVGLYKGPEGHSISQSTTTEEIQLQGRSADDRLNYQVGGYLEYSRPLGFQTTYSANFLTCTNVSALQCTGTSAASSIPEGRTKYYFTNLGAYAQATYKITDQLSLTGGFRYTWDRTKALSENRVISFPATNTPAYRCAQPSPLVLGGTSAQVQADPSRCDFRRAARSDRPTWLIDVDFKPWDDVLLYAKYSRGYRQGSVNVSSYGLETWEPEKVDAYEVGFKSSFHGAVEGTFNVAGFYNELSNQQLLVSLPTCTAALQPTTNCILIPGVAPAAGIANAGQSTIKGVEVDASIRPFTGLSIDGSYAYLDTKLKSITIPATPPGFLTVAPTVPVGFPLPLTPRNKFTVTGTYTLPLDESVGRIAFGATFTHQDSSFGSNNAPNPRPAAASTGVSAIDYRFLPPQNILNLNASWNSILGSTLDLSAFATNVTNNKFRTFVLGGSFGYDSAVINQPRMYGARLRYRFGAR